MTKKDGKMEWIIVNRVSINFGAAWTLFLIYHFLPFVRHNPQGKAYANTLPRRHKTHTQTLRQKNMLSKWLLWMLLLLRLSFMSSRSFVRVFVMFGQSLLLILCARLSFAHHSRLQASESRFERKHRNRRRFLPFVFFCFFFCLSISSFSQSLFIVIFLQPWKCTSCAHFSPSLNALSRPFLFSAFAHTFPSERGQKERKKMNQNICFGCFHDFIPFIPLFALVFFLIFLFSLVQKISLFAKIGKDLLERKRANSDRK